MHEPKLPLLHSELFPEEEAQDRKVSKWALLIALAFHAVLLFTTWPEINLWSQPERKPRATKAYVVQQVRFRMPSPPPAGGRPAVRKKVRLIPVPDPTPELPEPELPELPEIDFREIDLALEIPVGPAGPAAHTAATSDDGWAAAGQRHGAQRIVDGMKPPIKIYGPQPNYTEAARQKKLEGYVIVETIINPQGKVVDAKIRKGMTLGLSESAVEAVMQWEFKPATLDGKPVAVYFVVSVAFRLQ